jgi:hypothetical protein
MTFARKSNVVINTTRFREHATVFASALAVAWNEVLVMATVSSDTLPPVHSARVLNISGEGGGASPGSRVFIFLGVVAERYDIAPVWASLQVDAAASNASFQGACVAAVKALLGDSGVKGLTRPADVLTDASCLGDTNPCIIGCSTDYGKYCGNAVSPQRGDCAPSGPHSVAGCICQEGFSGQYCSPNGGIVLSLKNALGIAAAFFSIVFTCYSGRKVGVARLRRRHSQSIGDERVRVGKFDWRDRITIFLWCGTFHEDGDDIIAEAMEDILDPLVPAQTEEEVQEDECCAALRRWWCWCKSAPPSSPTSTFARHSDFASAQSRDEFNTAGSFTSSKANGGMD